MSKPRWPSSNASVSTAPSAWNMNTTGTTPCPRSPSAWNSSMPPAPNWPNPPNMNLASSFAVSVQKRPQKIALSWGEREYSYAELLRLSTRVAEHLQQDFGVKPGDRVGLWLKNCPEFIPSLFGILHAGAVVVPINNFLKPDEVNYILNDAGIDVLITDADLGTHHRALEATRPQLKLFRIEQLENLEPGRETLPLPERAESDLAVIIYASGTTGRPKGAMLSHGNLLHNVESCRIVLQTVA